jgi:hypothetical protein
MWLVEISLYKSSLGDLFTKVNTVKNEQDDSYTQYIHVNENLLNHAPKSPSYKDSVFTMHSDTADDESTDSELEFDSFIGEMYLSINDISKTVKLNGQDVQIDENMVELVTKLNNLGYETKLSCESHYVGSVVKPHPFMLTFVKTPKSIELVDRIQSNIYILSNKYFMEHNVSSGHLVDWNDEETLYEYIGISLEWVKNGELFDFEEYKLFKKLYLEYINNLI